MYLQQTALSHIRPGGSPGPWVLGGASVHAFEYGPGWLVEGSVTIKRRLPDTLVRNGSSSMLQRKSGDIESNMLPVFRVVLVGVESYRPAEFLESVLAAAVEAYERGCQCHAAGQETLPGL